MFSLQLNLHSEALLLLSSLSSSFIPLSPAALSLFLYSNCSLHLFSVVLLLLVPLGSSPHRHAPTRFSVSAERCKKQTPKNNPNLLEMKSCLLNFLSRRKWPDLLTVLFSSTSSFTLAGFHTKHWDGSFQDYSSFIHTNHDKEDTRCRRVAKLVADVQQHEWGCSHLNGGVSFCDMHVWFANDMSRHWDQWSNTKLLGLDIFCYLNKRTSDATLAW